jgi:hypothetical protein
VITIDEYYNKKMVYDNDRVQKDYMSKSFEVQEQLNNLLESLKGSEFKIDDLNVLMNMHIYRNQDAIQTLEQYMDIAIFNNFDSTGALNQITPETIDTMYNNHVKTNGYDLAFFKYIFNVKKNEKHDPDILNVFKNNDFNGLADYVKYSLEFKLDKYNLNKNIDLYLIGFKLKLLYYNFLLIDNKKLPKNIEKYVNDIINNLIDKYYTKNLIEVMIILDDFIPEVYNKSITNNIISNTVLLNKTKTDIFTRAFFTNIYNTNDIFDEFVEPEHSTYLETTNITKYAKDNGDLNSIVFLNICDAFNDLCENIMVNDKWDSAIKKFDIGVYDKVYELMTYTSLTQTLTDKQSKHLLELINSNIISLFDDPKNLIRDLSIYKIFSEHFKDIIDISNIDFKMLYVENKKLPSFFENELNTFDEKTKYDVNLKVKKNGYYDFSKPNNLLLYETNRDLIIKDLIADILREKKNKSVEIEID